MDRYFSCWILFLPLLWATVPPARLASPAAVGVFSCDNGYVSFRSEAPLEIIQAESRQLRGMVDSEEQTFAWTVEIRSFAGFNSPLQHEHFNENYLESKRYPRASFSGKIIETVDFSKDGTYSVRAKGKLQIHGREQERIVKGQLVVSGNRLRIQADFSVLLSDHDIRIPKIVYQKIAEEVQVRVEATLTRNAP